MYVAVVAVPQEIKFEAPAFEEYLIANLKVADNVRGVNRARSAAN